jgi:hypothetical protein
MAILFSMVKVMKRKMRPLMKRLATIVSKTLMKMMTALLMKKTLMKALLLRLPSLIMVVVKQCFLGLTMMMSGLVFYGKK